MINKCSFSLRQVKGLREKGRQSTPCPALSQAVYLAPPDALLTKPGNTVKPEPTSGGRTG